MDDEDVGVQNLIGRHLGLFGLVPGQEDGRALIVAPQSVRQGEEDVEEPERHQWERLGNSNMTHLKQLIVETILSHC